MLYVLKAPLYLPNIKTGVQYIRLYDAALFIEGNIDPENFKDTVFYVLDSNKDVILKF